MRLLGPPSKLNSATIRQGNLLFNSNWFVRAELLDLFADVILFGEFTLASGAASPYYLDARSVTLQPKPLKNIAELMLVYAQNNNFHLVAGPATAAIPIVTSLVLLGKGQIDGGLYVRSEAKKHGTKQVVEGAPFRKGDRCLVVDDVITSGGSLIACVQTLREAGLDVTDVVTLVDRSGGKASSNLREIGVNLDSIFRIEEILAQAESRLTPIKLENGEIVVVAGKGYES